MNQAGSVIRTVRGIADGPIELMYDNDRHFGQPPALHSIIRTTFLAVAHAEKAIGNLRELLL